MLFSPVSLEVGPPAVGLAPVGVAPEHAGRGVGSRLVREGLAACRALGYGACVVLGDPAFYARFGFEPARGRGLGNEYGAGEEFMAVELAEGALAGASGTVRYGPEFRDL